MNDVQLTSFQWRNGKDTAKKPQKTVEIETTKISTKDASTSSYSGVNKETQTEVSKNTMDVKDLTISLQTAKILEEAMSDDVDLSILDEFHSERKVILEQLTSYRIETRKESVISIAAGPSRKTCVLFGSSTHDTFCSHLPRVLLATSSQQVSTPIQECPRASTFVSSTIFVVGDIGGKLIVFQGGNALFEHLLHSSSITSVDFSARFGLLSTSEDGSVTLSEVGPDRITVVKTMKLTVNDLPRSIRRSSTSSKSVAIVSCQRFADSACMATETGGLWLVGLPEMSLRPLSIPARPVIQILYQPPLIAVTAHDQFVLILNSSDGSTQEIPIKATMATRCGQYFCFSDGRRLLLWSTSSQTTQLDIDRPCLAITSISSDTIIILTQDNSLTTFSVTSF